MSMTVEQALARVQAGLNELPWRDHEAEIALATLRAEIAQLEKDAGRYRWLRDHGDEYMGYLESWLPLNKAEWDAAIDAARQQESSHEG